MQDEHCYYKSGYKYQLSDSYHHELEWGDKLPVADIETPYIELVRPNQLLIRNGYAWDGPSGPTIDTKTFIRGSLVHDALYQLMREGHLDPEVHRQLADLELRNVCIKDKMFRLRAWLAWKAVQDFAAPCAEESHRKPVLIAPRS